ncbi:MAG: hypothetical protein R2695_08760 [Acidimicrobiales bacterium]
MPVSPASAPPTTSDHVPTAPSSCSRAATTSGTWDLFPTRACAPTATCTLGCSFKPWTAEKSIADGPAILDYLRETVRRTTSTVTSASVRGEPGRWSSEQARWTLTATRTDTGETTTVTGTFLFMCSGYYSYKGGYTPEFAGHDRFRGEIVHPQQWPDDLDYRGQERRDHRVRCHCGHPRVAMARTTPATSTMLQRSPTYVALGSRTAT